MTKSRIFNEQYEANLFNAIDDGERLSYYSEASGTCTLIDAW